MASTTIYADDAVWGSSSFNSTVDQKVGKTGSGNNDGTRYKGRCTFPAIPASYSITTQTLVLNRIDSYNAHTLSIGTSIDGGFNASLDWTTNIPVSYGKGLKTYDLTEYAKTIQGYGSTWYLHIRHGSGTNSYSEFSGEERADDLKPQLVIEYTEGHVYYYNNGSWQPCLMYYFNDGGWQQVIPYYFDNGWVQV